MTFTKVAALSFDRLNSVDTCYKCSGCEKVEKAKQVFILGAPRSGTTFLASLLECTEYGAPFETQFIPKYYYKLQQYGDLNKIANFERLVSNILSERAIMQWKLHIDVPELFRSFNGDVTFSGLVDVLCSMAGGERGGYWGEKTPWYLRELPLITKLFPKAKYIYIVRDGRDVALSLLGKEWGPNNLYSCAEYWKDLNKLCPELEKLERNNQLISMSYEDLLDRTSENVARVYEFLEQSRDNRVEGLISKAKKGNYNKWKADLSSSQVKLFENVCGDTLQRFGYETTYEQAGVPKVKKLLYLLHDRIVWGCFMIKTNIIDGFRIRFLGKEPFAD